MAYKSQILYQIDTGPGRYSGRRIPGAAQRVCFAFPDRHLACGDSEEQGMAFRMERMLLWGASATTTVAGLEEHALLSQPLTMGKAVASMNRSHRCARR